MFKKSISCLIIATFLITLSGCFKIKEPQNPDNSSVNLPASSDISSDTTTQSDKKPTSKPAQTKPSVTKPTQNSSGGVVVEKPAQNVTSENTSVSSPTIEVPVAPVTYHTPLSKDEYYQYLTLDEKDKEIYKKISTAIETTQNVVNLKDFKVDFDTVWQIYQKLIADNPQYFWVSKFITYTETSENGQSMLVDFYVSYTDGDVTDTFDDKSQLIVVADRQKIQNQIESVNQKIKSILSGIPANAPVINKEKLIHDAVLKTVSYDYSAVDNVPTKNNYPRVWDIFGALCNQKAVCEGYSKLFQYLCYQVGINSTFVHGTSENQPHAWNAVNLNGSWYHIDTTWDDASNSGVPLYDYFNLTTEEICADHTIDQKDIVVPTATATEYSFTNTFGMKLKNLTSAPLNYQKAIDYTVQFDSPYLYIMVDQQNISNAYSNYLMMYFFGPNSEVGQYIKNKGYQLSFEENTITYTDSCIFIKRK